jgi:type VI protein secretion system component VasK
VGSRLKLFKKGKHYIVDVEILKRALRELVEREPSFLRDLMLDALRSDGGAAEVLLELLTRHPEAKLKLAQVVAGSIAVPLNVATKDDIKAAVEELKKWAEEKFVTKEDLKQYATKQDLETAVEQLRAEIKRIEGVMATKGDIKRIEDKMATKELFEAIAVSVEDSGRDIVQYLLEQRGYKCIAERLRLDAEYELDIYCNAGALTAVGEVKVSPAAAMWRRPWKGRKSCCADSPTKSPENSSRYFTP